jgi:hypothetical protein
MCLIQMLVLFKISFSDFNLVLIIKEHDARVVVKLLLLLLAICVPI